MKKFFLSRKSEWNFVNCALVNNYNDRFYYSRTGRKYSRGGYEWVDGFTVGGDGGNSSSGSGDSDGGGEAIAYLLLIFIIVLMFIGSAFISHFWVFACIWGLTLAWLYWHNNEYYLSGKRY